MAVPTYTREQLLALISTKLASSPNTIDASEHRELETAIVNAIYGQVGDIKEIACDINYINNNFITTGLTPGLGKPDGERYGWAICNGNNGTIDKRGRVGVGYNSADTDFSTLGYTSGTKTVTLTEQQMPPHRHKFSDDTNGPTNTLRSNNDIIPFVTSPTNAGISANGSGSGQIYQTSRTGGSSNVTQAHNNLQPYIVTLFIQRIPMP